MEIQIADKLISSKSPCFIIAEAGVNHNGDFSLAKRLVDRAKEAGADAIKFQTFQAEKLVTLKAKQAEYQSRNIGQEESQHEMLKGLEFSYADFRELKKYCDQKKIIFLSTPHSSKEDIDLVSEICPAIKIGSGDLTNLPVLKYVAAKNLPVIISTGMAYLEEVKEAVDAILPINQQLALLHCTTNYPTLLKEVNLKAMLTLKKEFNLVVGYSDHTEGIKVSLAAVALGASIIEKHFTLDKNFSGPDHRASLEPKELKTLVDGIRIIEKRIVNRERPEKIIKELNIEEVLGEGIKKPNLSEIEIAKVVRKSIIAKKEIKKGEILKEDALTIKRPGTGIKPKFFNEIIGKKAKKNIKKDELIKLESLI